MGSDEYITFTVRLPGPVHARLEAKCRETGITRMDAVRLAVHAYTAEARA